MQFPESFVFPNEILKILFSGSEKAVPHKQLFVVHTRVCCVGNPEENGTT